VVRWGLWIYRPQTEKSRCRVTIWVSDSLKTGHSKNQIGPMASETGQHPMRPPNEAAKKAPARGWGELGELGLSDLRDKNASRDQRTMAAERFKFHPLL
jgi:hypothetical protein